MRRELLPKPETNFASNRLLLQRKCACGQHTQGGECVECAKKRQLATHGDSVSSPEGIPSVVAGALHSSSRPLDVATRQKMEQRFGHDFSQVRIHSGDRPAESARALQALAFTVGSHIYFGEGQYMPETSEGNKLLAHELMHVVQQRNAPSLVGGMGQAGDFFEQEADRMAAGFSGDARFAESSPPVPTLQRSEAPADPSFVDHVKACLKLIGFPNLIARAVVIAACLTPLLALLLGPEVSPGVAGLVWVCIKINGIVMTLAAVVQLITCVVSRYIGGQSQATPEPSSAGGSGGS